MIGLALAALLGGLVVPYVRSQANPTGTPATAPSALSAGVATNSQATTTTSTSSLGRLFRWFVTIGWSFCGDQSRRAHGSVRGILGDGDCLE